MPDQTPTQVQYPWKATLRTAIATVIGAVIVMTLVLPVALDVFGTYMSDAVKGIIIYVLGILVAIVAFGTRIMAIPQVNDFLTKLGLGASK